MKTPQLETERLLIKPLSEEHIDDWFEMDSDPEVHTYISQSPVQSKDEIREALKFISQQYKENVIARWAVVDKISGGYHLCHNRSSKSKLATCFEEIRISTYRKF